MFAGFFVKFKGSAFTFVKGRLLARSKRTAKLPKRYFDPTSDLIRQCDRVAEARGVPYSDVLRLAREYVHHSGRLGPELSVSLLNFDLDRLLTEVSDG